jgi:AcrR family transcriptional regulator
MAYEVTKRINGHDYRYVVQTFRDPETKRRRTKWTYVGAIDGHAVREPASRARKHVTSDDIVAAVARLLEFRDPEHVTVAVIAREAGVSRSTFYRYFPDERKVFAAALARMRDEAMRAIPPLDNKVRTVGEARASFRRWFEAKVRAIGQLRPIQRAILDGDSRKMRFRLDSCPSTEASLEAFFRALVIAGIVAIPDPIGMSRAIVGSMIAVVMAPHFISSECVSVAPNLEELHTMFDRAIFPQVVR